jgi:hypothetical protein
MILSLQINYTIILMSSSPARRSCFSTSDLILFRLLSVWNCSIKQYCFFTIQTIQRIQFQLIVKNQVITKSNSLLPRNAELILPLLSKNMSQVLSSGRRKYTAILEELINKAVCRVECKLAEAVTIINGVKKEKVKINRAKKWPKGQAIKIDVVDTADFKGILFKRVEDTSIRNL